MCPYWPVLLLSKAPDIIIYKLILILPDNNIMTNDEIQLILLTLIIIIGSIGRIVYYCVCVAPDYYWQEVTLQWHYYPVYWW